MTKASTKNNFWTKERSSSHKVDLITRKKTQNTHIYTYPFIGHFIILGK